MGMHQLEEDGKIDVLGIVSSMRQDRGGMVQTLAQYIFLHEVYILRLESLLSCMHEHLGINKQMTLLYVSVFQWKLHTLLL